MLKESQRLHYVVTEVQGPSIKAEFTDCKASIQLPMEKVRYDLCFFYRAQKVSGCHCINVHTGTLPVLLLYFSLERKN